MSLKVFKLFCFVILILISIKVAANAKIEASTSVNCQNCTVLLPHLERFKRQILTRRKRSVIFPKKAFLLLTQAFTKAIIDGRPPGLQYSIEFDMYSSLPDSVEAWQPTILNNRLKAEKEQAAKEAAAAAAAEAAAPTPIMPNMQEASMMDDMQDSSHELEHLAHWNSFEDTEDLPHFIGDDDDHHHHYGEYDFKLNEVDNDAPAPSLTSRNWSPFYNDIEYREQLKRKQFQDMVNFYDKHFWKQPHKNLHRKQHYEFPSYSNEDIQNWPPVVEEVYESAAHVPTWKYHQAYRERRDLFHQIEALGKIFNIDMKSCIQRAMCELKSNLRPYGESLMEDIVRIIFTIPKKLNFKDDYAFDFSQHDDQPDCKKIFKKTCPYRVIDFLTNTLSTIKLDDIRQNAM